MYMYIEIYGHKFNKLRTVYQSVSGIQPFFLAVSKSNWINWIIRRR